jgi:hypothetical protein
MLALGGIVLGPALAIGGFMMASKAEEALTKAHQYEAEVATAIANMEVVKTTLKGVRSNAKEITNTINELVVRFEQVKVDNDNDPVAFEQMLALGVGLKKVLDVAIIADDGGATKDIKRTLSGILTLD